MRTAFETRFEGVPHLFRAPGRVNLIGEHTDYSGGWVLPVNTALAAWVAIQPRSDRRVRAYSTLFNASLAFSLDDPERLAGWGRYVQGVPRVLERMGHACRGADLLIAGSIPPGGGLSSSAALEAALVLAFLQAAGRVEEPTAVARICQAVEHEAVGVQCGIMDPFVILQAPRGHALFLDCRSLEFEPLPLPADLRLLVVDSGVSHELADGEYNLRRTQCEAAAEQLGVTSLRDADPGLLEAAAERLDPVLRRRARHVISENRRVTSARDCLVAGDLEGLGQRVSESHASLRDDFEVSCPELDRLVELSLATDGVLGARLVGGGFGGCALVLVRRDCLAQAKERILSTRESETGDRPWHHVVAATDPAGLAA